MVEKAARRVKPPYPLSSEDVRQQAFVILLERPELLTLPNRRAHVLLRNDLWSWVTSTLHLNRNRIEYTNRETLYNHTALSREPNSADVAEQRDLIDAVLQQATGMEAQLLWEHGAMQRTHKELREVTGVGKTRTCQLYRAARSRARRRFQ